MHRTSKTKIALTTMAEAGLPLPLAHAGGKIFNAFLGNKWEMGANIFTLVNTFKH